MTLREKLKQSQFIVGLVRAFRGLIHDIRVVIWLAKRNRQITNYLVGNPVRKLQLAASNNLLSGWLNTDIVPNFDSVVYLDATTRFPFDDDTFDCIMAEHMIEHIGYDAAQSMLRECFRVLKAGGRIRIATPDLGILLALHTKDKTNSQRWYIEWAVARFMPEVHGCEDVFVINNFFRAWGHSFLYDRDTLSQALLASRFSDVKFYRPGESEEPMLENLECHGKELQSEKINQFETMVIEGCKKTTCNDLSEGSHHETTRLNTHLSV